MKAHPKTPIEEDELATFLARFARGEPAALQALKGYRPHEHPACRGRWIDFDGELSDATFRGPRLTAAGLDLLRRTGRADAVAVALLAGRA